MSTMAGKPQRSLASLLLDLSIGDSQIELQTFTDALNFVLFAKRRFTGKVSFSETDVMTAINTYRQAEAQYAVKEKDRNEVETTTG